MTDETNLDRRLNRVVSWAATPRRAALVIASVTTTITIVSGVLMSAVDSRGFPSIGAGLWWAVQTVTTVGYGDHVPTTVPGKLVATVVMLLGIGFVTVFTASITSAFVARRRKVDQAQAVSTEVLAEVIERLERIEARLNERP
jgi:voltage-gated potassium channel